MVFEGEVDSVTSFNEEGKFDILAQHANFISLIKKSLTIRDAAGKLREIKVDNALLRMKENQVEVYLGVQGMTPSELQGKPKIEDEEVKKGGV
jgi:F0F1-type ATP synthase epsilon subunit